MDKQAFNIWAGEESIGREDADRIWAVATSKLAFPSLNVVEAATHFVIAEKIDLVTMPNAGIVVTDYGSYVNELKFDSDTAVVDAAVKIAMTVDHFFSITAFLFTGAYVRIEQADNKIIFSFIDQTGTFTLTLREVKHAA